VSKSDKAAWDTPDLPQGDEKAKVVQNMFDAIAPRYELVNRIMTFRLDTRWRKIAVGKLALARGARVLDLDLLSELRRGSQGHRNVIGHLIARDRNHGGMSNGPIRENGNIGRTAPNIDQAHPKIFLVIGARQTLADFLMDGRLYKKWDINFVERNSKVIDETQ
jgi:hypothetical protein